MVGSASQNLTSHTQPVGRCASRQRRRLPEVPARRVAVHSILGGRRQPDHLYLRTASASSRMATPMSSSASRTPLTGHQWCRRSSTWVFDISGACGLSALNRHGGHGRLRVERRTSSWTYSIDGGSNGDRVCKRSSTKPDRTPTHSKVERALRSTTRCSCRERSSQTTYRPSSRRSPAPAPSSPSP